MTISTNGGNANHTAQSNSRQESANSSSNIKLVSQQDHKLIVQPALMRTEIIGW
jgi:hypothetical protein